VIKAVLLCRSFIWEHCLAGAACIVFQGADGVRGRLPARPGDLRRVGMSAAEALRSRARPNRRRKTVPNRREQPAPRAVARKMVLAPGHA
jgi:hypothetical protein